LATPTLAEIRERAVAKYQADRERERGADFTGKMPEDRELREGGYFYQAQRSLMKERGRTSLGRNAALLSGRRRTVERHNTEIRQRQRVAPEEQRENEATADRILGATREERQTARALEHMTVPEPRLLPIRYTAPQRRPERAPPVIISATKTPEPPPMRPVSTLSAAERTALEGKRQRGETLEETQRRIANEKATPPPAVAPAPTAPGGAPKPPATPAAAKKPVRGRLSEGQPKVGRARPEPVRHVAGLETRLERVPHETYSLYGKAGMLEIYAEAGPFGKKYYRVKFQGRTFTPTFDTPEQAASFANTLKARTEPEYQARRERMVEADSRYFTESTIAHRQHPLFVKVIDRTGKIPPGRLTA
jgi:hypothetical protein